MQNQVIPKDVKAAMWQFFLKTSVPRLIEKKRAEAVEQQETEIEGEKRCIINFSSCEEKQG